eukprot:CAMPEP_0203770802 /NCGR_PEP_ID=MMETSP0099_2-20121227/3048_1 /ASSEMBLY_ACC=CAM_ASM_000209 /TAXON_ID=96639 /ORGANISM=" , Strain NY0313808BC1" /LENGTH=312 /DNA_ID=CAMNT_0050668049 /DNA_START=50 /DNA_END=988 /DNA_ORIENTATION=+
MGSGKRISAIVAHVSGVASHHASGDGSTKLAERDAKSEMNIVGGESYADVNAQHGSLKGVVPEAEWKLRCDLAAAYRAVAMNGWDDSINNHLTVRIPGTSYFLINCMGLGFEEVTASSLVTIDIDGNVIRAGSCGSTVNKAGFIIHSALHKGREDAHCVMHTHECYSSAVSSQKGGLLPLTQTALLCGEISYHDFEGVAVSEKERETLLEDVKANSYIVLLRNHGILTFGSTVAQAWVRLYYMQQACQIQINAQAGGVELSQVKPEVIELVKTKQALKSSSREEAQGLEAYCVSSFELTKRRVGRRFPGFDA